MKTLALLLALLLVPVVAHAYTCSGASCTATLSYTEPSTYVGGNPLTNLQDGQFTYQLNGGANQVLTVPASRPQGGGTINSPLAAQAVAVCTTATLTGSLVMRTSAGGVSAPTSIPPLVFDRTKLADGVTPNPACSQPNPATGVTAQ